MYKTDVGSYGKLLSLITENKVEEALKKFKEMLPEYKFNGRKLKFKTALVSVSDKSRLNELSDYFLKNNIKVISSGGTFKN